MDESRSVVLTALETPGPAGAQPRLSTADAEVVRRATHGDRSALPRLRELFARDPAGLLRQYGDLAEVALGVAADRITGEDLPRREALPRQIAALRAELAGDCPAPAVRLLAEQVVLCWLDLHALEIQYQWAMARGRLDAEHLVLDRLRSGARRGYLQAIAALEGVRRLQAFAPAPAPRPAPLPAEPEPCACHDDRLPVSDRWGRGPNTPPTLAPGAAAG